MKRYKFLRTRLWIAIGFSLVAVFFSDCKKYPDGPNLSFRSRTARIATIWYIDSYLLNGSDQTAAYTTFVGTSYALSIGRDGSYMEYGNFPDEGN